MLKPRYQRLKNLLGKLAGSDIGTYEIKGNLPTDPPTTVTALKIVPPEPLANWVPHGIEIILQRVPNIKSQSDMHWRAVHRVEEWEVILTQYDRGEFNQLADVCSPIMGEFGSRATQTYQPQSERSYERANIYITLDRHIRPTT